MHPPLRIRRIDGPALEVTWPDGRADTLPLRLLRDECPCAGCKGETILGKTYMPTVPIPIVDASYELEKVDPDGSYGVQLGWRDGHNTGIYSWEYLRLLGEGGNALEWRKGEG